MSDTLVHAHNIFGDLLYIVPEPGGYVGPCTFPHMLALGYSLDDVRPFMDRPMLACDVA